MLVHHLRKQGDSDPLNKLSGTTGISGTVDAVFVLDKSRRNQSGATLICTGRDIEYRELELNFSKEHCLWELVADSADAPEMLLPAEMVALIAFMHSIGFYSGSNGEFTQRLNVFSGNSTSAKALKQMMNKWRYPLEDAGVEFRSYRSNGQRLVDISFSAVPCDASDGNDTKIGGAKTCVPGNGCGNAEIPPFREGEQSRRIYARASPVFRAEARTHFWMRKTTTGRKENLQMKDKFETFRATEKEQQMLKSLAKKANMSKICDEIFGESNFISQLGSKLLTGEETVVCSVDFLCRCAALP